LGRRLRPDGEPRPRDVVPPAVPRRRMAPLRPDHAVDVRVAWAGVGLDLHAGRPARRLRHAGRACPERAVRRRVATLGAVIAVVALGAACSGDNTTTAPTTASPAASATTATAATTTTATTIGHAVAATTAS